MPPAAPKARKRGSKASSRRRTPKRRRSSFVSIAVLLLIPAFLAVVFLLYLRSQTKAPSAGADPAANTRPALTLLQEARKAGLNVSRVRNRRTSVEVETIDSLRQVEKLMRQNARGGRVVREADRVVVTRANEKKLIFNPFRTSNSGAGLTEVDESNDDQSRAPNANLLPPGTERRIVMILDDVGFERQPLDAALRIPAVLNFAIIPGSPHSRDAAAAAVRRGHEVLCHLPMEADSKRLSPGSVAILSSMNSEEIGRLTRESFRLVPGARGFNNHMGSLATADRRVMREVFRAAPSGMYFIDSRTTSRSVAADLAHDMDIPTRSRDVFLDNDPDEEAIRRQIAALIRVVEANGVAVAIGHMYPSTVKVLGEEIPRLQARGFRFIRASESVN